MVQTAVLSRSSYSKSDRIIPKGRSGNRVVRQTMPQAAPNALPDGKIQADEKIDPECPAEIDISDFKASAS